MLCDGTLEKLIQLIKLYNTSTRARVQTDGEESREFDLCSGVHRGCHISNVLLNYAINWIITKTIAEYISVQIASGL